MQEEFSRFLQHTCHMFRGVLNLPLTSPQTRHEMCTSIRILYLHTALAIFETGPEGPELDF